MISVQIEWRPKTGKFSTGNAAYVGSINVGSTDYTSSKQPGGPWAAHIILPGVGIREAFKYQITEEHARKIVEVAVDKWFASIEPAIAMTRRPHKSED